MPFLPVGTSCPSENEQWERASQITRKPKSHWHSLAFDLVSSIHRQLRGSLLSKQVHRSQGSGKVWLDLQTKKGVGGQIQNECFNFRCWATFPSIGKSWARVGFEFWTRNRSLFPTWDFDSTNLGTTSLWDDPIVDPTAMASWYNIDDNSL